ncbi:MAG: flagellar basal body rod protein FlgB [Pseudomonadota bacterium]
MTIGFDAALGVHPSALTLRAHRTEVLANNVANADTPNYKARDFDFKAALAAETGTTPQQGTMRTTHSAHIGAGGEGAGAPDLEYRIPTLPSLDGNTVDAHVEQSEFADNTLNFMASMRFLDGKFKGLLTAIKGE